MSAFTELRNWLVKYNVPYNFTNEENKLTLIIGKSPYFKNQDSELVVGYSRFYAEFTFHDNNESLEHIGIWE